ncbi:isocitrate lyase/phosphoenolpyruvate mutase family protein (plasmid) [Rhizobium sp. T1470]|uniref:isocitrate lyase/phosphoenolpyruvate mutase family protein n=1 Tax=unclassified Rhizobium TaxID=2613769 RepID=UPI001AAECDF5|nr:isocitrate lyase/phosphoenolpyruvate mutase family protein [Rhizobium sp. T1473]MCA0806055.1 isocitrate lyase/phosphoenolpyruvate mutase family protein [Rhizobium sp. T1473]
MNQPSTSAANAELLSANSSSMIFRNLILSSGLTFLTEAHDCLSAVVAESAEFKGLWAPALSIYSALGYRTTSDVHWTQVVNMVDRMLDGIKIPVLVDCDSGLSKREDVCFVARKLEECGAAGVCLEGNSFPKMNSFESDRYSLATIENFCGDLKAVKDATGPAFVLVARVETQIGRHGPDATMACAAACAEAGADAILIHSRKVVADDILCFARRWDNRLPVIIVPTRYFRTPVSVYLDAGISTVIWPDHSMRAMAGGMRETFIQWEGEGQRLTKERYLRPLLAS